MSAYQKLKWKKTLNEFRFLKEEHEIVRNLSRAVASEFQEHYEQLLGDHDIDLGQLNRKHEERIKEAYNIKEEQEIGEVPVIEPGSEHLMVVSEPIDKPEHIQLTEDEIKQLDNYKIKIRKSIQAVAIRNYPRKAINRKLQGIVNIIFELNEDGSLINVRSGPNTKADEVLINAAIKILEESAPFDKIPFSKQKNEFSININYILR